VQLKAEDYRELICALGEKIEADWRDRYKEEVVVDPADTVPL
jgi:hypothetical protein